VGAFGTLFSSRYLTGTGIPGIFYDIHTALLGLLFVVCLFAYLRRRPLSRGITPRRHLIRMTSQAGMWIAIIGLFLALMRYLEITYLDMRFYSYLVILGAIAYCAYLAYVLSERFPLSMYQFEQATSGSRYRPGRPPRRVPATAQPARSGMQRGKRRR